VKVYFGSKGSRYYILCPDFSECYSFNMFGTLESSEASISSCSNWVEVDFISFVNTGGNKTELLFNDSKTVLNKSLLDCTSAIRDKGNYLGTMFTISHKDSEGMFTQVFFVAHKGLFTKRMLEERFSIDVWDSL